MTKFIEEYELHQNKENVSIDDYKKVINCCKVQINNYEKKVNHISIIKLLKSILLGISYGIVSPFMVQYFLLKIIFQYVFKFLIL